MIVFAMLLAGSQPVGPAAAPRRQPVPGAGAAAAEIVRSPRVRELERIVSLLATDGPPPRLEGPIGM